VEEMDARRKEMAEKNAVEDESGNEVFGVAFRVFRSAPLGNYVCLPVSLDVVTSLQKSKPDKTKHHQQ
jgi:hypothetical protein